jgi:3-phenylpropionate/cinnamic acid dioxygenase small subunit
MKNAAEILDEIEALKKEIELLKDQDEIRDILTRYAFGFDLGRYDEWYDLWSEDAVFQFGARRVDGLAAIRDLFGPSQKEYAAAQHLQLTEITKVEGDQATSVCYQVILVQQKDDQDAIGNRAVRHWTFEKKNGKWRIKSATSTFPNQFPEGAKELMPADW